MEALHGEIINLVVVVLTACMGLITKQLMSYLKKKGFIAQLENNKETVKVVVNAIEQMYKHLHGEEKLNMAKMEIIKLAKEKKIKISEKELDLMIESVVKEMNDTVKKELKNK